MPPRPQAAPRLLPRVADPLHSAPNISRLGRRPGRSQGGLPATLYDGPTDAPRPQFHFCTTNKTRKAGSAHIRATAPRMGREPCVAANASAQIALFRTCVGVLGGTRPLHASAASTAATKDGAFHSKLNASKRRLPFCNNPCDLPTTSAGWSLVSVMILPAFKMVPMPLNQTPRSTSTRSLAKHLHPAAPTWL